MRLDVDGSRRYYVNGIPTYAGLVYIDGYYYYFNINKVALRSGTYSISKTNGLLPEGTYTFDSQCRMVDPPEAAAVYSTTTYQVLVPDETVTYRYTYNGGSLSQMTVGNDTLYFTYANGTPMSVTYNNTTYYYVTNLQGDVVAILDTDGTAVVQYTYDAWGNILTVSGSMSETLGEVNPLTYRGYVYDHETGLYYLQSRYYDPEVGRFLNADNYVSTGGILGYNMFAYCCNNPVMLIDKSGQIPDSYAGGIGQDLGELIYEWLTGEEHPSKAAEEKEKEISQRQNKLIRDGTKALWDAYIFSIELEAEAQYQQDMAVKSHWEDTFSSPTRLGDFAAMTFTNCSAYATYVGLATASTVTLGGVVFVVATIGFAAWSTLRYYNVIS